MSMFSNRRFSISCFIADDLIRCLDILFIVLSRKGYVTMLLEIGENTHEAKLQILKTLIEKLKKETKNIAAFRIIKRDPKIDKVIVSESGSGLKFKDSIPDAMIEIRMDEDESEIQKIALQLLDTKIVKQIEILKPY